MSRITGTWAALAAMLVLCLGGPARVVATVTPETGNFPVLVAVGPSPDDFSIRTTMNLNAADTTNTDQLWSGGGLGLNLTGAGVTVGVWDAGAVRATHQEFGGRVTVVDAASIHYHATHVAGTIGAAGTFPGQGQARGMANAVSIRSRDWTNDYSEMAADAALIQVSNHSYGSVAGWYWVPDIDQVFPALGLSGPADIWWDDRDVYSVEDPSFGKYDSGAQALDQVLYSNPKLLSVWSAGNDRNDAFTNARGNNTYVTYLSSSMGTPGWYVVPNSGSYTAPPSDGNGGSGYDSLPGDQVAKNNLVVGAINDITADPYGAVNVTMASFSSWGPTDDGRVKPDVVANGVGLYSTDSGSNTAYASLSGTSMSSPNVAGTAALLIEHFRNLNGGATPNSATTKGLIIHTAFDAGNAGPDYVYGWGVLDAAAAANFLTDAASASPSSFFFEDTYSGTEVTYDVFSAGTGPFKATLAWTDPAPTTLPSGALDDALSVLVNDLDLWITGPGGTFYPWTLDPLNPGNPAVQTQLNHLDNVVQVLLDSPSLGDYTIHIGHTGSSFIQDYSLLFGGVTLAQQVIVPEPSALVLTAIGLLFLLAGFRPPRSARRAAAA